MPNIIEITDLSVPELDIYARLSEPQLLHIYEPDRGLFIAESPKVIERALDAGYVPVSLLLERKHITGEASSVIARCEDIPIYTADFDVLTKLTGFELTRGVLCAMRRAELPTIEDVCTNARRIAILENVMNPTNIGAMALSDKAISIDNPQLMSEEKLAIVLGTEGDGLASCTIAHCDYTVCIPMSHGVDSLNVAAASAVAFWQLGNR